MFFLHSFLSGYFITSVKDSEGKYVRNRRVIFKHYLKRRMAFDLLSFCSFGCLINETFLIFEIFRLAHFPETIELIRVSMEFLIKKTVTRASQALTIVRVSDRIVTFCIYFVVSVQILTCLWIYVSSFREGTMLSWISLKNFKDYEIFIDSMHLVLTYSSLFLALVPNSG